MASPCLVHFAIVSTELTSYKDINETVLKRCPAKGVGAAFPVLDAAGQKCRSLDAAVNLPSRHPKYVSH